MDWLLSEHTNEEWMEFIEANRDIITSYDDATLVDVRASEDTGDFVTIYIKKPYE